MKLPTFLENPDPNIYWSNNYVVLDFETTNRDKGSALDRGNRIVLATWLLGEEHPNLSQQRGSGSGAYIRNGVSFKRAGELEQSELVQDIEQADFIVAQNSKFELQWLTRCGIDISRILPFDTLLADYVEGGNTRRARDLDSICKRNGIGTKDSLVKLLLDGGVCPSDIPENWLLEYGCGDTSNTHKLFLKQRRRLAELGLLAVLFTRCIVTPVLADIEPNGMQLDEGAVKEKYEQISVEHSNAARKLNDITGGINLDSPKQVAGFLYDSLGFDELRRFDGEPDRTEAGGRRTDADTIASLEVRTQSQREVAEVYGSFRPLETSRRVLEKMKSCCEQDEGLLYAVFNQAVTQTHRLSSSGKKYKLQFQNFDRNFKPLFRARNAGWCVGEADGAQLEFRVAAHLGRDPVALEDIRNPAFDAHYQTAEQLLRKLREEISKDERQDAKPRTFKPLYGGMTGTPDERRYYKFFQQKYSAIYNTQKGWTYDVLKSKRLRTEWGLTFYWPDTRMFDSGYIKNTTSIYNYPVQSLATAEIIPIALVYFWHRARALGLQLFVVNTIHDSIIVELPPEEEDIFRDLSDYCFTRDVFAYLYRVYGVAFTCPLGTETKVGSHWSLGESRTFNLDPEDYFSEGEEGAVPLPEV